MGVDISMEIKGMPNATLVSVVSRGDAFGGLVVSVLAAGPMGYSVAGSSPTEDGGFLWVIKIHSTHFLRRGSKAVHPMSQIYGM
jgi:hypothetical protein